MTETELAKYAVQYFTDLGFEVYQEVLYGYQNVMDIVAVKGEFRWGIEVKLTGGMAVLEQAEAATKHCHFSSIFIPRIKSHRSRDFVYKVAKAFGFGIIELVDSNHYESNVIRETVKPAFRRKIVPITLHERQKHFSQAGGNQRKYWSPFKATCENLVEYVKKTPGCSMQDALKNIHHHYASRSSGVSCLKVLIGRGVIKELEFRQNKLYLKEPKDAAV